MADIRLSDPVKLVLRRVRVDGNRVYLPKKKLPRGYYLEVDKALKMLGGKWNGKLQAHVFTSDPRAKLSAALANGLAIDVRKQFQAFYTPPELAQKLVEIAMVRNCLVLEPSAGTGNLADESVRRSARRVDCFELDKEAARVLSGKGYSVGNTDFLWVNPDHNFQYDRVVMNPPFSKGQAMCHLAHALKFLHNTGILAAIMPMPDRAGNFLGKLNVSFDLFELPRDAFKKAGANWPTCIVRIRKGRQV